MLSKRGIVVAFIGAAVVVLMFAAFRLLPRYELRTASAAVAYRLDRWTGDVAIVQRASSGGLVLRPIPVAGETQARRRPRPTDQDILDALDQVQREQAR